MLLSVPCAYGTDDSSDNNVFLVKDVNNNGNSFVVSLIAECSGIISLYKYNLMKYYTGSALKINLPIEELRKREHERYKIRLKKKAEERRKIIKN